MSEVVNLSRRSFLRTSALAGGGCFRRVEHCNRQQVVGDRPQQRAGLNLVASEMISTVAPPSAAEAVLVSAGPRPHFLFYSRSQPSQAITISKPIVNDRTHPAA